MRVFRITHKKWGGTLRPSGIEARWNSSGNFVIYTAESRSLACLENIVHRSGEGLDSLFCIMTIELPAELKISTSEAAAIPGFGKNTNDLMKATRAKGDEWYHSGKTPVLRVPSILIPQEYNYILNTMHPDFIKVKLISTEDFFFDRRIVN